MTPATPPLAPARPDSLWLRVGWEAASQVFEFPSGHARAIAVGSSRTCDVRLRRRGLPPVCFCFERENDRILVVPMSDGDLRVGGIRVSRPQSLAGDVLIEFGGATVNAMVLTDAAEDAEPTSELPTRETLSSHMRQVSADADPTSVATAAVKFEPAIALPLETAPRTVAEDVTALPTEVMPVFRFWDEPARDAPTHTPIPAAAARPTPSRTGASLKTAKLGTAASFRDDATEKAGNPGPCSAVIIGDPRISTQDTTSFDLAALRAPGASTKESDSDRKERAKSVAPARSHRNHTPQLTNDGVVNHASRKPARQFAISAIESATRLGFLARRRPLHVAAAGLAAAVTVVLLLLGARQVTASKTTLPMAATRVAAPQASDPPAAPPIVIPSPAASQAQRSPDSPALLSSAVAPNSSANATLPQVASPPSATPSPRPASDLRDPTFGSSSAAPTHTAAQRARDTSQEATQVASVSARTITQPPHPGPHSALPADPDALGALKYIVDGHDADALRAYSALAARSPGNTAYRALVRLLERREQEGCTRPATMPVSCPDIRR